jgi:hypothetical protein
MIYEIACMPVGNRLSGADAVEIAYAVAEDSRPRLNAVTCIRRTSCHVCHHSCKASSYNVKGKELSPYGILTGVAKSTTPSRPSVYHIIAETDEPFYAALARCSHVCNIYRT